MISVGLNLGRLHRYTLMATASLGALGVMSGSMQLTVSGAVLVLALFVTSGQLLDVRRSRARTRVVHGLTVAGFVFALASLPSSRIDAGLGIVMLGIFNRFALRLGHRDDLLILGASAGLLAAATVITPGVLFGLITVIFVPSMLWALFASMMIGLGESSASDRGGLSRTDILAKRPVPPVLSLIAVGGLLLTLFGYLAVCALPRHRFGQFLRPGYFMALPGAANSMKMETGGISQRGGARSVLRVEPAPGAPGAAVIGLYARYYVLDSFDGRSWKGEAKQTAFPVFAAKNEPADASPLWRAGESASTVRVTMERIVRRHQPHPVAAIGRTRPSNLNKPALRRNFSGSWIHHGSWPNARLSYKVYLDEPVDIQSLPVAFRKSFEERMLALPELDPRVKDLAETLFEGKETAREKTDAVLRYFARGFEYSLATLPGTSKDPLVRFLFEAKQGHCELYASAVAVLLRMGGVPARVATGYYGGWWNELGGYVEFTHEDAHAWVEVRDGKGWRFVDATPAGRRSRRRLSSVALAWLRDMKDAIEAFWFAKVIDFDESSRKRLMASLTGRLGRLASAPAVGPLVRSGRGRFARAEPHGWTEHRRGGGSRAFGGAGACFFALAATA